MRVAVPKEITPGEQRVALVPSLVPELIKLGCSVLLEKGAGLGAHYADQAYQDVQFYDDSLHLYQDADIILKVQPPFETEITHFKKSSIVISFFFPARYPERVSVLREHFITSFAMEAIPRISRAQTMDALSSQATASGYKAALIAANISTRFFPMLTTAAGTIRPANVLVIGAGVAGLQVIATARRLGAIVKAYDIRSTTREQVESLGAKMINIDVKADASGGYARELTKEEQQQQQTVLFDAFSKADVVISTALIPGKPAPKIITREMVELMLPGSVIVDIAAEAGGNCELTEPDKSIQHHDVTIYGPVNLPSMMARDASNMYAKNIVNFLKLMIKEDKLSIDWQDDILAKSVLTHEGEMKQ
jgi:NAD(P) transhydrogenase subunit alpha